MRSYFQWANGSFSSVQWVGAGLLVYYLQRYNTADTTNITAFPDGFRMLTGNPFKRSYQDSLTSQAIGWNWYVVLQGRGRVVTGPPTADLAGVFTALQPRCGCRADSPAVPAALQLPERPPGRDPFPGASCFTRKVRSGAFFRG